MLKSLFVVGAVAIGLTIAGGGEVYAQTFPSKPIRMIAPAAGGGADLVARLVAQGLSVSLGQQVIVDNRGGASGIIAVQILTRAAPDGYTLLFWDTSIFTLPLMKTVPYDPIKDFAPITLADSSPNVLVVHPSVPVKSVKELIALAKAKPGQLNYGSGSSGASPHLAAELFNSMAGVNIVRIAYKGTGPAFNDLLGGQLQLMFTTGGWSQHAKAGRLVALAVTSAKPSALAPGLPTIAASGVPGYEAGTIHGLYAPAGTPPPIINRLYEETARVLNQADMKEKLLNSGFESVGATPQQFVAKLKAEVVKWGKVIKDANIRAE